jgi:hypothetical protein
MHVGKLRDNYRYRATSAAAARRKVAKHRQAQAVHCAVIRQLGRWRGVMCAAPCAAPIPRGSRRICFASLFDVLCGVGSMLKGPAQMLAWVGNVGP